MNSLAHIGGLPLEETVLQTAPVALAATVMALRLTAVQMCRWVRRAVRLEAHPRRVDGSPP